MNSDDLKPREAKLVKGLIEGKPKRVAALEAGYSQGYANNFKVEERQKIKLALLEAMREQGIDEKSLAKVMAEGLKAKKPVVIGKAVQEFADHNARHRFTETALKVTGHLADDAKNINLGLIVIPQLQTVEEWNSQK